MGRAERRRDVRINASKYAKLIIGDELFCRDCSILNLSLNGACVRVSRIVKLVAPIGLLGAFVLATSGMKAASY